MEQRNCGVKQRYRIAMGPVGKAIQFDAAIEKSETRSDARAAATEYKADNRQAQGSQQIDGKEVASRDRGTAIGNAAAQRPGGIAGIGPMSAAPQRRMH
jgi:hypothetical protein